MKKLFATLALAAFALALSLNTSAVAGEKATICHFDEDGIGYWISVSENAVDKHLENHGDLLDVDAIDLGDGFCDVGLIGSGD